VATWSAAILAGGEGRRLGGQVKPLLDVGGRTILERQRAVLAQFAVTPRLIARDPAPYAGLGLEVVPDLVDGGALGGLCTALETAPTRTVLVLAGDLPFVSVEFVQALLDALGSHAAAIPRTAAGWHPLAALYDRAVGRAARTALDRGRRRVIDVATALDVAVLDAEAMAPLDPDGALLWNVNTPADYAWARRHASHDGRHT
jgi:molybdopterin-guanine dinucleotide biosynthesis protein A